MLFSRGQKIKMLQKLNRRDYFYNILGFFFYGVSRTKADLCSEYILNYVFGSFFKQDHLLNLVI